MTILKLITTLLIVFLSSICFAQSNHSTALDTSKLRTFAVLPAANFYTPPSFYRSPTFHSGDYQMGKLSFCPNYADTFFTRPIYYNTLFERDFSYRFNPTNPWQTSDPFSAILCGTTNYLFQTMDKKYFYKKL